MKAKNDINTEMFGTDLPKKKNVKAFTRYIKDTNSKTLTLRNYVYKINCKIVSHPVQKVCMP